MSADNTETPLVEEETQLPQRYIRQKTDPAWGHCTQQLENGKTVLVCLYCPKVIRGGGINRLKSHLAGDPGQIVRCKNVPAEVQRLMGENIDEVRKKRKVDEGSRGTSSTSPIEESSTPHEVSNSNANLSRVGGNTKGKNVGGLTDFFMPRTTPGSQPTIKSVLQSKEVLEKCDIAIAKWMIDASVPFNAVNSGYYL